MADRRMVKSWSVFSLVLAGVIMMGANDGLAADWPQWRGPDRKGISKESDWDTTLGGGRPKQLWQKQIGVGYSSITVSDGLAYTMGNANRQDTVYCFDAESGREVWKESYACGVGGGYKGPRATPAVADGTVYTFSVEGHVLALDAKSGSVKWRKDLRREMQARPPKWGFSCSPVVDGNQVVLNVGSRGLALDKKSGRVLWNSGGSGGSYASAVPFDYKGNHYYAIFSTPGLVVVDAKSGREAWSFPWQTTHDVNAADPIVSGSRVFISSNYGKGCALLDFSSGKPRKVWGNREMKTHFNSPVLFKGMVIGNSEGTLVSIAGKTGRRNWQYSGIGRGGSVLVAGGKLLVLDEQGAVSVGALDDTGFRPAAKARVLTGQTWTPPALANGRLYVRNTKRGELVCVDLRR